MDPSGRPRLGFVGTGAVATTLSRALVSAGYAVVAIHGRDRRRAENLVQTLAGAQVAERRQDVADGSDLVVLAVPDDAIASVSESIAWNPGRAVVHCNGAASCGLLQNAAVAGAEIGVFHPLQSFANPEQATDRLRGCAFRIEASGERLRNWLEEMALALGGHPLTFTADPTLYHVSAVLASNYLVTLLDLASTLWPKLGVTREEGLQALLPLVRGTVENVAQIGIPAALTGPIARGDVGTVTHHLAALREVAPLILPVYKQLGLRAVEVALAKGTIGPGEAVRLTRVLSETDEAGGGTACG